MPASLRSEGVRVHPGMPFGFHSEIAFGFAGILIRIAQAAFAQEYDGGDLPDEDVMRVVRRDS